MRSWFKTRHFLYSALKFWELRLEKPSHGIDLYSCFLLQPCQVSRSEELSIYGMGLAWGSPRRLLSHLRVRELRPHAPKSAKGSELGDRPACASGRSSRHSSTGLADTSAMDIEPLAEALHGEYICIHVKGVARRDFGELVFARSTLIVLYSYVIYSYICTVNVMMYYSVFQSMPRFIDQLFLYSNPSSIHLIADCCRWVQAIEGTACRLLSASSRTSDEFDEPRD